MKLSLFNLGLGRMLVRYYLVMVVILLGGFTGQWWLAFLGFPLFLSALMGIRITFGSKKEGQVIRLKQSDQKAKAV